MRKIVLCGCTVLSVIAFDGSRLAAQSPLPVPTPDVSLALPLDDARSRREQAYLKLMEGQRHIWKSQRLQTQAGKANSLRLAKAAFQKAVEIDPTLAEGYTVLAELAVTLPPVDLDEAIRLAAQAVKIDKQNFGGHRMLARLYTIKSRINGDALDQVFAERAVAAWREVTRLDPRNAEGWAFLSEFAERNGQPSTQIEALRSWVSSAPALDVQFYERVIGGSASLNPETASMKLAAALAKDGKRDEAATILSALIADDAGNDEAIAMLGELVDSTESSAASAIVPALQQAVFANPANVSLIDMLARLQSRLGQFDAAAALLKRHSMSLAKTDSRAASSLSISLAELLVDRDRFDEAIKALEESLTIRAINPAWQAKDEDREFVQYVFEKLIHVTKLANRPEAAKGYIERSRKMLGPDDAFADRQMVAFLQSNGNQKEALALVRSLRAKRPNETGLLRLEASLLTALGQVDNAVALVQGRSKTETPLAGGETPGTISIPIPGSDEFSDLLFISNLYTRANRGKEAIETANKAISIAGGSERRQIAKVTLATGQHMSGDAASAERTLREVLKESPGNPMALNNLGYFLTERGEKLDEAVKMISQAVKTDPRNPSYLDSLGWAYFKLGKLNEAEKYLLDAARADTDSATILEHLGDVYKEKRELNKARSFWNRALRISTEAAEIERLKKKLAK